MGREQVAPANEVQLVGRVSGDPTERELPSGDRVVQLRVVVPRPARRVRAHTGAGTEAVEKKPVAGERPRTQVDTIDVACWTARARAAALRLPAGAGVQVAGSLRRRFFGAGSGRVSRYEVEASSIRRVDLA